MAGGARCCVMSRERCTGTFGIVKMLNAAPSRARRARINILMSVRLGIPAFLVPPRHHLSNDLKGGGVYYY